MSKALIKSVLGTHAKVPDKPKSKAEGIKKIKYNGKDRAKVSRRNKAKSALKKYLEKIASEPVPVNGVN